jgi:sulfoxide reductase heme-binding subunit YedZ
MLGSMNGITGTTALWYASRATGVVALVLLTGVLALGILVTGQGRLPGLPRFGPVSLHRSLSLLAVTFVAAHVATAIADPFVRIGIAASVVPFTSAYEPFWLGLGAVAADLMLALIVTSLLRARIGRRTWRAVHWLAYLTWPVAFAHSIGSGSDLRHGGLALLAWGCALAVLIAAAIRVTRVRRAAGPADRARLALAAAPDGSAPGGSAPGGRRNPAAYLSDGGPGSGSRDGREHAEAGTRW